MSDLDSIFEQVISEEQASDDIGGGGDDDGDDVFEKEVEEEEKTPLTPEEIEERAKKTSRAVGVWALVFGLMAFIGVVVFGIIYLIKTYRDDGILVLDTETSKLNSRLRLDHNEDPLNPTIWWDKDTGISSTEDGNITFAANNVDVANIHRTQGVSANKFTLRDAGSILKTFNGSGVAGVGLGGAAVPQVVVTDSSVQLKRAAYQPNLKQNQTSPVVLPTNTSAVHFLVSYTAGSSVANRKIVVAEDSLEDWRFLMVSNIGSVDFTIESTLTIIGTPVVAAGVTLRVLQTNSDLYILSA